MTSEVSAKRAKFYHTEHAFHRYLLLREKRILTDGVIISSDGKRFDVHCIVMAGSSDYYYTNLLNSNDQNTLNGSVTVNVPHQLKMNAEAVEQIIAFCYTGAIELNIENIESVLTAAKELEIKPLKLICTDMLEKMLDTTNCIRFLEIACKHSLQIVKKKALEILSTELQFFNRPETYGYLVDAVHMAENAAMNSGNYCEGTRSAFCAAFIAGFFEGNNFGSTQRYPKQQSNDTDVSKSISNGTTEIDREEIVSEESCHHQTHMLCLIKQKTVEFCCNSNGEKWQQANIKFKLEIGVESFRDAVMIPIHKAIVIFHMRNAVAISVTILDLDNVGSENLLLPHDVHCANLALLCMFNDKIYCFARTGQQRFHIFDPKTRQWSNGHIKDAPDAKRIVGFKNELYFLGCGYERKFVRSYRFDRSEWTDRGSLLYDRENTYFKAIPLNGSIYAVMSQYDSSKIYNGTEFVIQRFDEKVNDWVVIHKVYYSHFVHFFTLDVVGDSLYLFYGDGEVCIYNEKENEWRKGPTIDHNVLDVSLCMISVKSSENWMEPEFF